MVFAEMGERTVSEFRVIDLSNNNRGVDIAALVAADPTIKMVIVKLTEGEHYVDDLADSFIQTARSLGLAIGVYHCIRLESDPTRQALHFYDTYKAYQPDYCEVDWETFATTIATTAQVLEFMGALEIYDPATPKGTYAAGWIFGYPGVVRDPKLTRWPLVSPNNPLYPNVFSPWSQNLLWQYGYFQGIDISLETANAVPTFTQYINLNKGAKNVELVIVRCKDDNGNALPTVFGGFIQGGILAQCWWLSLDLYGGYQNNGVRAWEVVPSKSDFKNVLLLGAVPESDGWKASDFYSLHADAGDPVVMNTVAITKLGTAVKTLEVDVTKLKTGLVSLGNVLDDGSW